MSKASFNPLGTFPVTNCAARIETRLWTILKNPSKKPTHQQNKKTHPNSAATYTIHFYPACDRGERRKGEKEEY